MSDQKRIMSVMIFAIPDCFAIYPPARPPDLASSVRLNRASLQGSVFWMAPEVVKQTAYTKKADIWSVGCLVVEMLTGEHPWPDLTQMQAIFRVSRRVCVCVGLHRG